ncbi:MAG: type IX secretion system membrane protein PorP/SprF [Flavobacteriia bacterium]|nr:type IX secretion system membrane protein PorP/SprF [Flavobacteriia bacterium]
MKSPTHDTIDYWLFDWVEGNLSPEQEEELQLFLLLNPEYEADAEAWKSSKITFPVSEHLESSLAQIKPVTVNTSQRNTLLWWMGKLAIPSLIFLFWIPLKYSRIKVSQEKAEQHPMALIPNITDKTTVFNPSQRASLEQQNLPQLTAKKVINTETQKVELSLMQQNSGESSTMVMNPKSTLLDKLNYSLDISQMIFSDCSAQSLIQLSSGASQEGTKQKNKKRIDWNLRNAKLLKKYIAQEPASATQKDRIYVAQERTHLDLNEGLTGNLSQTKFQSTTQLRGLANASPKVSQQISVDGYSRSIKSGLGFVANYANFDHGTIQDWNVRMIYSPKIAINRFVTLEPSMSFSFGQKHLDAAKIQNHQNFLYESTEVQQFNYDMNLPIGSSLFYRDLNIGIMANLGPLYLGGQVKNLLRHQDNIETNDFSVIGRSAQQTTLIAGTDFSARKGQIRFSPHVIHEFSSHFQRTQFGGSFQFKNFVVGGNYGLNQSVTGLIGVHAQNVSFLYQATKNTSLITQQAYYLHQITLRISSKISRKPRRYISL